MNKFYVVQCADDPYCAPFAGAICQSLKDAMKMAENFEEALRIEVFIQKGNGFVPSGKCFNLDGSEYNRHSQNDEEFDEEISEALRLAGVKR